MSQNVTRVPAVFRKRHWFKRFTEELRMWPVYERVSREIRHFLQRLPTHVLGPGDTEDEAPPRNGAVTPSGRDRQVGQLSGL